MVQPQNDNFNHYGGFMRKMPWIKVSMVTVALCLLIVPMCFGDSGCEFGPPLKLAPYPGSVSATDGQTPPYPLRLSKDRQPDVRMYYAQQTQPAPVIQEQIDSGYRIQNIYQRQSACGKTRDVLLLRIMERTTDEPSVSQAFGALQAMKTMGMHSEAEYQQAVNQYGATLKAFFRTVNTPDGGQANEGRLILDKYRKLEKQQRGTPMRGTPQDKQQAAEMRRKAQEMKARGDYAGMQEWAQQYQGRAQGDQRVQQAKQEMNRDMWSLWLQCLKEMRDAAFITRLDYNSIAGK